MFKGYVFDVEGTLVDSVPQYLRSLQDALERSGYRIPIQTLRLYSGLDGDQTLQLVAPEAPLKERKAILKDQGLIYEQDYLPDVKPFEGVRDVFRILSEQGGAWYYKRNISPVSAERVAFAPLSRVATRPSAGLADGHAALMDLGRQLLGRNQVLPGIPELLHEVQVEGTFPDGTKLVTVHDPLR